MEHAFGLGSLWREVRSRPGELRRLTLYGFLATLLMLPVPLLIPLLIDEVLLDRSGRLSVWGERIFADAEPGVLIVGTMLAVALLRLAAFGCTLRKTAYAARISQRVAYTLRRRVLDQLRDLAVSEYETLQSGSVAARTVQDVETLSGYVSQAVSTAINAAFMLGGIVAVLFWLEWRLAAVVLLLHPLFFGSARILGRKTAQLMRRRQEAFELYQELLSEILELFVQIRTSNQEGSLFGMLRKRAAEMGERSVAYGTQAVYLQNLSSLLTALSVDLFRIFGVAAVLYSDLSLGMMIAFLFYLSAMTAPLNQLLALVIGWRSVRPSLDRINELMAMGREPVSVLPETTKQPFPRNRPLSVSVERLHFAYGDGPEVLRGISLHIEAGEHVAIYGASGGGKSTLAKLMIGLYPPRSGQIAYGGVPAEEIGWGRIRSRVALMLQESLFFNDTIRNNLTLYRDLPEERILEALSMAQLDDFVRRLDRGLETPIGRNGIRLSGGEKQRLAIARLVLGDPDVVIFDEATSALDEETETRLYRSLQPFLSGRTILMIAHRRSTIRRMRRVIWIDGGRIAAEGSLDDVERRRREKDGDG